MLTTILRLSVACLNPQASGLVRARRSRLPMRGNRDRATPTGPLGGLACGGGGGSAGR
jgi:hypothetical protein